MSSVKSQRLFWVREAGGESGCRCRGFAGRQRPGAERGPAHQDPESGSALGHVTSASLLQFPGSLRSLLV